MITPFLPFCPLLSLAVLLSLSDRGAKTMGHAEPSSLRDFAEVAKVVGWEEVYLPGHSASQVLTVESVSLPGMKAAERVVLVYGWEVLSSVEVPPSRKQTVYLPYRASQLASCRFKDEKGTNYILDFSLHPAEKLKVENTGNATIIETKEKEEQLVVLLQETATLYSNDGSFHKLHKVYTDTFAFGKFKRSITHKVGSEEK
jgi:hypothetical protein